MGKHISLWVQLITFGLAVDAIKDGQWLIWALFMLLSSAALKIMWGEVVEEAVKRDRETYRVPEGATQVHIRTFGGSGGGGMDGLVITEQRFKGE